MKVLNTIKSTLPVAAIICLALGFAPTSAVASTALTTTFGVSATVQSTCIISASDMSFGTYISTAVSTAASAVTVTCTNTTGYTVGLDAGLTGGSVTTRQMKNGSALLNYALFSDSAHTANWGNTSGSWVSSAGIGSAQVLNVYGQVSAGQYVTPGSFTDTITATITY